MDSALEDIEETVCKLESTMAKAENVFMYEQRQIYKRLLRQCCSQAKSSTPDFLNFLGRILKGKPASESRRRMLREAQGEADSPDDELGGSLTLMDTLPFSDLKQYYYTALEQGLKEANLVWTKREKLVFGRVDKSTPLSTEK